MIAQIITHPGSAHKDDFLSCCLLMAEYGAPVYRREPMAEELADPATAVVDVGGFHEPSLMNFDHHQFPADHPPLCALSLVLQYLDLYEDAKSLCDWLEPVEWFDTRGPVQTAAWLGVERELLGKLQSTIELSMMRRFASAQRIEVGSSLWDTMSWVGSDLLHYLRSTKERLRLLAEQVQFWDIVQGQEVIHVMFLPRVENSWEDPSGAMGRYLRVCGREHEVCVMVYPDRRGSGYGLSRQNDHPRLDFTRISHEHDVHFAHARGFVAKTKATAEERLRELISQAWI
jgi:hypothetical protein